MNSISLNQISANMKGVIIMTEEKSGKRIAQLDLNKLSKNSDDLEDLFDMLIAQSRKKEKNITWSAIKADLKKKGKL